ncbi:hypothetical protein EXIGLDRAFT_719774 [Exidia glandulosa HHB12029]|uniref:F-box domain-containing protein n=1 Tax=Exidia glandulosa HHB12029 TaxID=1314781 RepID=A0A166ADV2_EXIGL|nr:hypothetical protein EXIGLDRAFT_719774 [Exidia glandulosa HHB12029]
MAHPSDMLSLPLELIREIIELVAYDAIGQDLAWVASALVVVSRDIRAWVHPILYHTIHIHLHNDEALLRLLDSKPSEFFAPVRHIILVDCFPGTRIAQRCLARLPKVKTFTVDDEGFQALKTQYMNIRARRIIMTFAAEPGVLNGRPFEPVTHLRLLLWRDFGLDWSYRFSKMPRLSHIVFDLWAASTVSILEVNVRAALAAPSCQRVVVQVIDQDSKDEEEANQRYVTVIKVLRLFKDSRVYAARVHNRHLGEMTLRMTLDSHARTCAREALQGADPWSIGERVM